MSSRVPMRGLACVKTLAGRSDKRAPAHKAYLRVSFLELERARHGQEIGNERARVERMVNRCREIEMEEAEILSTVRAPNAVMIATPAAVRTLRDGRRRFNVNY